MSKVRVHVGKDEVTALREPWEALQHHPNSDFDHFLLVCSLRKEVLAPVAFSYWRKNQCVGIVCARIEHLAISPKLGYLKLPSFKARCLTIIHEGVLGNIDEEGAERLLSEIIAVGRSFAIQRITFYHLPQRFSAIWSHMAHHDSAVSATNPKWVTHRALKVERTPGFLLRNMRSKHRSWFKRKEKELNEAYGGHVQWLWYSDWDSLDAACRKMETVARTTYQRRLGAGFIDDYETRKRLELFAKRGQFRAMILEGRELPLSFWYGLIYKKVFHMSATGYRPEGRKCEAGTLTLFKIVDALVQEGIEMIDFGLGDADYKKRFGNLSWKEATVHAYGNDLRSRWLKHYEQAVSLFNETFQRITSKSGMASKVKKAWRSKLRPNS